MTKTKEQRTRLLTELYEVTEIIDEAQITPVLEGSCRIQGPMSEETPKIKKNTGSSQTEKRSTRPLLREKGAIKPESGTCNVCAAPCSSCMHFKRAGSLRGVKTEEDFSNDEKKGACRNLNSIANETSNLASPSSSNCSFSGNTEKKAAIDESNDGNMLPRVVVGGAGGHNQSEEQKVFDCTGDDISCVNGASGPNKQVGDVNVDLERKDIVCSTASGCLAGLHSKNVGKMIESSKKNLLSEGSARKGSTIYPISAGVDVETGNPARESNKCLDLNEQIEKANVSCAVPNTKDPQIEKASVSHEVPNSRDPEVEKASVSHEVPNTRDPQIGKASVGSEVPNTQDPEAEKASVTREVPNAQEPPSEPQHVDDSDASDDFVEADVKVCDICGDAGREDSLAICSRCTDGAEHTYCMRMMMAKLPEKDWFCEGCQLKVDVEKQKQDKIETVLGNSKVSCQNEKGESSEVAVDPKIAPKLNNKLPDTEANKAAKVVPSSHGSFKRPPDNVELAPPAKRQTIESSFGSPKPLSPSKKGTFLREKSFKNSDQGKVKPIQHMPLPGGFSANNSQGVGHTPTVSAQNSSRVEKVIRSPRGTLLKSSSFGSGLNSRPKVQPIQDVPQKHKLGRNSSMSDAKKDGLVRSLNKSLSFKATSTQSTVSGAKTKLLTSSLPHTEDLRGLKAKERSIIERKSSFRSDRVVSPTTAAEQKVSLRGETMPSSASNSLILNAVQPEGRLDISSKETSAPSQKEAENPSELGHADIKRQPSVLSRESGNPCLSGSLADKRATQVIHKDVIAGNSSGTADRLLCDNNPDIILQVPQLRDPSNQDRKAREPSFSQPHQSNPSGARSSIRCQKCKEIGHATQACPNAGLVPVQTSHKSNSIDVMDGCTILKDAAEASVLKRSTSCNNSRLPSMFMPSTGLSCAVASKVSTPNCLKKLISSTGVHDGQESFRNPSSDSFRTTTISNVNSHALRTTEVIASPKEGDSHEILPSDQINSKPFVSDFRSPASSLPIPSLDSVDLVVPVQGYIWKGGFEVQRGGTIVDLYGGIKAHLSVCASPKVPEMVTKFQQNIILKEESRSSTWPIQFQNQVREENIALYFFPGGDTSQVDRYYVLLENMRDKDLALKGDFDGIELLIFPSTHFSASKGWNGKLFLWGVFRGRRVRYSNHTSGSQKKLSVTDLNVAPLQEESGTSVMAVSRRECSSMIVADQYKHGSIPEAQQAIKSTSMVVFPSDALSKQEKPSGALAVRQVGESLFSQEVGCTGNKFEEKIQERLEDSRGCGLRNQEKMKEMVSLESARTLIGDDQPRSDKEPSSWAVQSNRKRPYSPSTDMVSQASAGISLLVASGVREADSVLVDRGDEHKKMKRSVSVVYNIDSNRNQNFMSGDVASQMPEERLVGVYDGKVLPGSSRTSEMHLFPMDLLGPSKDHMSRSNSTPVQIISSDDEDQVDLEVPNLELALGAEKRTPRQGVLPLFTVMADQKNKHVKLPDVMGNNSDDDLSLSLSVPFSDKGKTVRPVKGHTNMPGFMFGGSSGL